jgi:APA family basic amino acid/polyamine antiporter
MSMAQDGLLPSWAGRVHKRYETPHVATLVTGAIVAIASGFTPIAVLGELVSIGTLFRFVIACSRCGDANQRSSARSALRWVPLVPIASVVVSLALMVSLPGATWARLVIWMALGFALHFTRSAARRRRARL